MTPVRCVCVFACVYMCVLSLSLSLCVCVCVCSNKPTLYSKLVVPLLEEFLQLKEHLGRLDFEAVRSGYLFSTGRDDRAHSISQVR